MGGIPIEKALSALGNALNGLKNKIPFLKNGNEEATIIDGKKIAADIRLEIKAEVDKLKTKYGVKVPGLAVVIVGQRKDSQTYVRM